MTKMIARNEPLVDTDPERLSNALARAYQDGRLLTAPENLRPRKLPDGRWSVVARMLVPAPAPTARERLHGGLLAVGGRLTAARAYLESMNPVAQAITKALAFVAACFTLLIVTLFGVGYLVFQTPPRLGLAASASVFAATVVAVLIAKFHRARRAARCSGLHCNGCGGRH